MTRNVVAACAAALALCVRSGCGTMINLTGRGEGPKPYGGVEIVAKSGVAFSVGSVGEDNTVRFFPALVGVPLGMYLLLVETPLSAVGDTLTLPYVLYLKAQKDQPTGPPDAAK